MKDINAKQIITIIFTVLVIAVNGLANALPLNGQGTGEISDRFDIYFVPAGYVFSIWGIIYLGLLLYTVYQALPAQKDNRILDKLAPAYWISSIANVAWIFLWHYEVFEITLIAMIAILVSLLLIYVQLKDVNGPMKWLVRFPFSIYLGWISVATIANASQLLYYIGWQGFGLPGSIWAIIMISVATILGLVMSWLENDLFYNLVLVWAFIGISISQANTSSVVIASWVGVVLLVIGYLVSSISHRRVY
jgi:hypothetical protein